jgi:hypothetical protein
MSNEKCPFVVGEVYKTRNGWDAEFLAYRKDLDEDERAIFLIKSAARCYSSGRRAGGEVTTPGKHPGDILPPEPKTVEAETKVKYRPLRLYETILPTDEYLTEDCVTWKSCFNSGGVGTGYSRQVWRPMRRAIEAEEPKLVERWVPYYGASGSTEEAIRRTYPNAHSYHKIMVPE